MIEGLASEARVTRATRDALILGFELTDGAKSMADIVLGKVWSAGHAAAVQEHGPCLCATHCARQHTAYEDHHLFVPCIRQCPLDLHGRGGLYWSPSVLMGSASHIYTTVYIYMQ